VACQHILKPVFSQPVTKYYAVSWAAKNLTHKIPMQKAYVFKSFQQDKILMKLTILFPTENFLLFRNRVV